MITKNEKSDYILVISGGGSKGMYACGILKAIEEVGLKPKIKAIYGVSAGALTGAYWLSGWKAEDIFKTFLESELFSFKNIAIPPKKSLLKSQVVENILKKDLKKTFKSLRLPLTIGTTDLWKGKFLAFNDGDLLAPLMGSMAVPGVFAPIEYDGHLLVDGGVTNNFPVNLAKKEHPNEEIIGILLAKFKKNQKVENLLDTLLISYNVLLRARLNPILHEVDHLFYRDLNINTFENNPKKLKTIFDQGYQDGMATFSSLL